tara:strand:+ start:20 stop:385 length:366 start_codon:yes stop_codon:yes gene_type:complete
MKNKKVNINNKFRNFTDLWSPKVIAEMNNYQFKLAKIKGSFIWHSHDETDEVFIVMDGTLDIHLRDKKIHLQKGEMYVVPQGVEHKPEAEKECKIMLIEQKGTVNTGDLSNNLTSPNDIYI